MIWIEWESGRQRGERERGEQCLFHVVAQTGFKCDIENTEGGLGIFHCFNTNCKSMMSASASISINCHSGDIIVRPLRTPVCNLCAWIIVPNDNNSNDGNITVVLLSLLCLLFYYRRENRLAAKSGAKHFMQWEQRHSFAVATLHGNLWIVFIRCALGEHIFIIIIANAKLEKCVTDY